MLIREAQTLRLHDLAEDPRSVGFPRNHPPMQTFLGVPILLRGVAYGNLYLTEKDGGDFTEEDEELTQLLAAQAAVAIENARLYESSTRWLRQLESLNEIGNALASELELEPLLGARRAPPPRARRREARPDRTPGGRALRVAAAEGQGSYGIVGMRAGVRRLEGRARARARPQRAHRLGLRGPRDRPAGGAALGIHRRSSSRCSCGAADRGPDRARQGREHARSSPTTTCA